MEMRLPTWRELQAQPEQRNVLEHPLDRSLFVVGPPGSGKTVLALQRARLAAQAGRSSAVAVVTFNRMLRRLLSLIDDGGDLPVFTMHRFVWHDYSRRTRCEPPNDHCGQYSYDWTAMLDKLRKHDRAAPNKQHLVVDEGQDLPEGFFTYASRHVSEAMTAFADEDQAHSPQGTTIEQIKNAGNLPDPVILTQNHRNTPEIARLAEHFHGGRLPAARVLRASSGDLPRLVRPRSPEAIAAMISNWFGNRRGSIGVIVDTIQFGRDLHAGLSQELQGDRVDVYESSRNNEDSINVLKPGVTILNKKSVKGQEFDTVFILELDCFIPFADNAERRAMYMMCTRARDNLFLIHGPATLSREAVAALPGPDVLERS